MLNSEELKEPMHFLKLADYIEHIIHNYGEFPFEGLNHKQLTQFFNDWKENELNPSVFEEHWWFDLSDEELYGGMRHNMKEFVMKFDINGDGFVTAREFLVQIKSKVTADLLEWYGEDYMWWRDELFVREAIMSVLDFNENGHLELDELKPLLEVLGMAGQEMTVLEMYAEDSTKGLTHDEVETFLHEWAHDGVEPPVEEPWWFYAKEEQLYGGMATYIKDWVLKYDMNDDGFTTLREYLSYWGNERAEDIITKVGEDAMWWKNGNLIAEGVAGSLVADTTTVVTCEALSDVWPNLDIPEDKVDGICDAYGMDWGIDFISLFEEWAYGILKTEKPIEYPFWWDFTDEELYGGLRSDIKKLVLKADHNNDGKVTAEEYLTVIKSPAADELLQQYGWDIMWWRSADFIADAMMPIVDTDQD